MNQLNNYFKKRGLAGILALLLAVPSLTFAQERQVTGTVIDEDGNTIPGATVLIVGTNSGDITDIDGKYSITASSDDVLRFSFVGMKPQDIQVGDRSVINVTMLPDNQQLEEVIVMGFGVRQEKAAVVGAISQVDGESIQQVKMGGSLENSLQGALPGLTVIQSDPTPGEEALGGLSLSIRGIASMGNNTPLYIVDGVERPFSNIDPNEIESISILKDASATAVYGVRGANGVIIVNTKRGASGRIQLEYSSLVTMKEPTILPEYMNSYQTMQLRNTAYRNDGNWDLIIPDNELAHYRDQDLPYLYPDTDWMDFLYGRGWDHQHNLNARGGNDFVKYFVSVGYLYEGDVMNTGQDNAFPYNYDELNAGYRHQRFNFRNNLDFQVTPTTELSVSLGGNIKIWRKPDDTYTQENWFEPVTGLPYYPEDILDQYPDELIPYDRGVRRPYINPAQGEVRLSWNGSWGFDRNKGNQILSDIKLTQKLDFITEGLSVTGLYSYNTDTRYRKRFRNPDYHGYYLDPETLEWTRFNRFPGTIDFDNPSRPLNVNNADQLLSVGRSHWYQVSLDYNRKFGEHTVTGQGIFQRRQNQGGTSFPSFQENWIGRATYNYAGRYFFEASVAHSGSEKFGPGLRFGTFPAFAGGWRISEEDFWSGIKPVVNNFKLRYSYGIVGSDAGIARWLYRSFYEQGGSTVFGFPRQTYGIINEGPIPVTDATWEDAYKQNLGIELGFLNNEYTLSVDLYNERRTGVLQTRQSVPAYIGTTSAIQGNIGETKSQGIEVEFGVNKSVGTNAFIWGTANVAATENRVVFYDESDNVPFHLKAEGKPVDIAQRLGSYTPGTGLIHSGFYQSFDELFMLPTAGGSPVMGDLRFIDFNGDGNVDQQDYVVSQYPLTPLVNWNATIGFDYKNWSISTQVYGISNVARPMRQGGMFFLFPFSQNKDNAYLVHNDHWRPDNRDAAWPTPHSQATNQNYNYQISQFSMVDGMYVRLRNLRLAYTFDSDILSKIGMREMTASVFGTNLLTWRKRDWGGDPEGFNFGEDFGNYPQMKRYTLEIRAMF